MTGLQHQRAAKETGEVSAEPTKYFNIWRYVWKWSQFLNPFPLVCSSFLRPLLIICPVCVVFSFNYTLHKIFICLWVFLHECVCVIPNPVLWWWITASLILHRLRANGTVASIVLEGMTNTYAFGFVPVCVPVGLCVCVCRQHLSGPNKQIKDYVWSPVWPEAGLPDLSDDLWTKQQLLCTCLTHRHTQTLWTVVQSEVISSGANTWQRRHFIKRLELSKYLRFRFGFFAIFKL